MTFCQLGSAQFSLLNRACTGLLTLVGSPWASATVDSAGLPALADGDGLAEGEGLAAADADGDALGDAEAFGDALAFPLPLALAEGVGVGVGVGVGLAPGAVVFDAS